MRTLQIITGLTTGGAEMMLFKVLSGLKMRQSDSSVVCLGDQGVIATLIKEKGINVIGLGLLRSKIPSLLTILKLRKIANDFSPDLIQGWMYHGNLAATLCGWLFKRKIPVVWNVRQTLYKIENEKKLTQWVIRANAFLSKRCDLIIYNSKLSAKQHEVLGFSKDKTLIIPNGFDTKVFTPDDAIRRSIRDKLGIPQDSVLIGLVGRYHPMKDHSNFLSAAKQLRKYCQNTHFVMVGTGVTESNSKLIGEIVDGELLDFVHLLGERNDIPQLTASFDIAVSASAWGEGFPNVLGEAMSCGVPCVATDVGDSAWVVGNTGFIVPPTDSLALFKALEKLTTNPALCKELGEQARRRVIEHFSLDSVVDKYESTYRQLL